MNKGMDRRKFIKQSTAAGVGLGMASRLTPAWGMTSPNDRIVVGAMGVNGRGNGVARSFEGFYGCDVKYVCDVDERAVDRTLSEVEDVAEEVAAYSSSSSSSTRRRAEGVTDFRRILDDPDVDALVICATDHWHAPAAILAMEAGKHVYLEKPGSHNPQEAEWVVQAARRYDRRVQLGNQQRSDHRSQRIIAEIHDGLIGRPYYAHTWYAATRGPIGHGQVTEVPDWLDYELWQGPAPRRPFRDNLIHYNWHWFWHWGTGEICNNATHELDIARWALQVERPLKVTSSGGRYHYDDDWEFYDTQIASFDFPGDKSITWHGRSCNGFPFHDRGRGVTIHGEEGTVLIDRNGYVVYDLDNNELRNSDDDDVEAEPLDTVGGGGMTDQHVANFLNAIRGEEELTSEIESGQRTVMLCHLGNIAQYVGRSLSCNPETGRIIGDAEAMQLWGREYEPGWRPQV